MLSDKNSNLKYMKVYNWGKTIIISGVLKYGAKFPSENVLMRKFGFSRETIRGALEHLENEGLIERVRGSGTYVSFKMEQSSKKKVGLIFNPPFIVYIIQLSYNAWICNMYKRQPFNIIIELLHICQLFCFDIE